MKVQQAPVQRRISQVAAPKAQKVHYSDISNLKSELREIKNSNKQLGASFSTAEKLSTLKQSATDLQTRLSSQETKATGDKKQKVGELLKQITILTQKDAPRTESSSALSSREVRFIKQADLKNSHANHSSGLGLSGNTPSHLQFDN